MGKCFVSILLLLNITSQVQLSSGVEGLLFEFKDIHFFFFKDAVNFVQILFLSENVGLDLFLPRDSLFLVGLWYVTVTLKLLFM